MRRPTRTALRTLRTSVMLARSGDPSALPATLRRLASGQDGMATAEYAIGTLATELLDAGDVSRTEAGKVFKLTRAERAAAFPARSRSESSVANVVDEPAAPVDDPTDQADQQHPDLGQ